MNKTLIDEIERKIYSVVHKQLVKIMKPEYQIGNVKEIDLEFVKKLENPCIFSNFWV